MCRAVDHPLLDQLGAHGTEAADLDVQHIRDVSRALLSRAEVSNGPKEVLFAGSEAVKARPEEIQIETGITFAVASRTMGRVIGLAGARFHDW